MNLEAFLEQRQATWSELEDLVRRAKRRPERLGPHDLLRLGASYRSAAADLAVARRAFGRDPVVRRLEELVGRSRYLVYDAAPRRGSLVSFFANEYWRRIAQRPRLLAIAALLLVVPAVLGAVWALSNPGQATGFVPNVFGAVAQRHGHGALGIPVASQGAMSSAIFSNNIRVTFLAFAAGISFGLGTAYLVAYNGAILGVVGGLATASGNGRTFVELVTAHGVLELSCIVVTAAAGLRIGAALIDPGYRTRGHALVVEGRAAVEIVLGTIPWLVCAGLVEGFVTPSGFGLPAVLAVGLTLGACFWGLVLWRGREPVLHADAGLGSQVGLDTRGAE